MAPSLKRALTAARQLARSWAIATLHVPQRAFPTVRQRAGGPRGAVDSRRVQAIGPRPPSSGKFPSVSSQRLTSSTRSPVEYDDPRNDKKSGIVPRYVTRDMLQSARVHGSAQVRNRTQARAFPAGDAARMSRVHANERSKSKAVQKARPRARVAREALGGFSGARRAAHGLGGVCVYCT